MMEAIFKYFWMFMIICVWLIWGYFSVINIIACFRNKHNSSLDDLLFDIQPYVISWMGVTFGGSALASFIYWFTKR